MKTFRNGTFTSVPTNIYISGNSATIEWQAGNGNWGSFVTKYTSDGAGTGNNFECPNYIARQYGFNPVTIVNPPSNIQLVSSSSNSVNLKWTDNSSNESGMELQRLSSSGNVLKSISLAANTSQYTDNGLNSNTTYKYRVRAINGVVFSDFSNIISVTTGQTAPAAPGNLTVVSANGNSVSLSWKDNSSNESGFEIQRLNSSGTLEKSVSIGANSTSYTDNGLQSSTTYSYRVRAINTAGNSSFSNTVSAVTKELVTAPSTPTNLKATSVTSNSVIISWTDNSNNEAGFHIERLNNSGTILKSDNVGANVTSYNDNGLSESTVYMYRLTAYNPGGSSGYSDILSVTTKVAELSPITNFVLNCSSWDRFCFAWNDNSNDETGYLFNRYDSAGTELLSSFSLPANTESFIDTLLNPDTFYSYSVMAYNSQGSSDISWIKGIKTDKFLLSPPYNLHALFLSYDSIGFGWENPPGAENILVYKQTNSGDYILIDSLSQGQTKYVDNTTSEGNIYNYKLIAEGFGVRSGPSNILSVNTSEYSIQAPGNLYASNIKAKSLQLVWSDLSLNESGYKLIRKSVSTGESVTIKLPANSTTYEDKLLSPEQQYEYTVFAYIQNPYSETGTALRVQTLSLNEVQRDFNNLVAYYNFQYVQNNVIPDLSGYQEPLNLLIDEPVNSVKSEKGAISIVFPAHVRSVTSATKIVNACKQTNELSIELWVNSYDNNFNPSTIISLANDSNDVGFEVQQDVQNSDESPYYKVLLQTKSTFSNGLPAIQQSIPHRGNTFNHFVFTHSLNGDDCIYVNGELVGQGYRFPSLNTWKNDFYLTLADNGDDEQPFIGSIYLCAVYNKALTQDQVTKNYLAGPFDGIVKSSPSLKASISPNPVVDNMVFQIERLDESIYFDNLFYKISDSYGNIVVSEKLPYIEFNKFTKDLDLSSLEPGVYFLYILNSARTISNIKIVKLSNN